MSLSAAIPRAQAAIAVHRTVQSFRAVRNSLPQGTSIGFVPTMGALHEGHLSLVKEAKENNDLVVASIYVNPTQFGEGEDLDKYPRTFQRDSELLNDYGVDHIFAPDNMYGEHHVSYVDPTGFNNTAEGKARPGHFRGVATIVTKLLNIIQPTNAYFGQKDAAQCVLIRRIVSDLDMNVHINVIDTMRETDGLALSSRNAYLNLDERKAAVVLYKSLCAAKELYNTRSTTSPVNQSTICAADIKEIVMNVLQSESMVKEVQYVAVDNKETMEPLDEVGANGAVVSIACVVGSVRLIDNCII